MTLMALGGISRAQAAGSSCEDQFSAEKVAAGDLCTSQAGDFCPAFHANSAAEPYGQPFSCNGVRIDRIPFTTREGLVTDYLAIRGPQPPKSVYLALHYLGSTNGTFANVIRLQELARARRVLVLVPQAPSSTTGLGTIGSNWPRTQGPDLVATNQFLDDVVADGRTRFQGAGLPLYVAGLSNGGAMVYLYACAAAARVDAILSVGGAMGATTEQACQPSRPIGTVIVHGTSDPVNPYNGFANLTASVAEIHSLFESRDGCAGSDKLTLMPPINDVTPEVTYSKVCKTRRRHFIVSMRNGGHTWPGQITSDSTSTAAFFNPKLAPFDATLQGYDLLQEASGR